MPHSFGYRARTRHLFAKDFRKSGQIALTRFQTVYKIGDVVDIKGDGAFHKGMPHKFYHGKTGIVWNVTRRAIGVIVNKRVGGRIIPKRVHFRIEHVKPSKSHAHFIARIKENERIKAEYRNAPEAEKASKWVQIKRLPAQPEAKKFVKAVSPVKTLAPKPFVWLA
eukprot:TRINITY_DN51484_c0_g1_i1.p1 TRINITY_DN51484_c0_g1~~TRINITY_DN51484_c0_g1_i1.p1  ORF type:complete len:166 (+),score=18.31 TRINITY_DN51484_c0_g1_i1:36-533(+)